MAKELSLGVMTGLHPTPLEALEAVRRVGIPTVQVQYGSGLDNDEGIRGIEAALAQTGIEITTIFCGYAGESYADIATVHQTVGLVPDATREERLALTEAIGSFAARLGVARVAAHLGFIPEDADDAGYRILVEAVRDICDACAERGQVFALETGQETAQTLRRFIGDVGKSNLRVNFDPANMILYGNGEPIPALDLLAPWVDGVHCKDGKWPTESGKIGHEMPLGQGDVGVPRWIEKLLEVGYRGPLTIEREISGDKQKRDILRAKVLLESCLSSSEAVDRLS